MARPPRIPMWLPSDQRVVYFVMLRQSRRGFQPRLFLKKRQDAASTFTIHALIFPKFDRNQRVTQFSAVLKRSVPRDSTMFWRWQHGVLDRLLRREEFSESKWVYMRENPVRAGLVKQWEDWPYLIGYTDSENNLPAA